MISVEEAQARILALKAPVATERVALAKAAYKGVIHANNAARRSSRLTQAYNKQTAA